MNESDREIIAGAISAVAEDVLNLPNRPFNTQLWIIIQNLYKCMNLIYEHMREDK